MRLDVVGAMTVEVSLMLAVYAIASGDQTGWGLAWMLSLLTLALVTFSPGLSSIIALRFGIRQLLCLWLVVAAMGSVLLAGGHAFLPINVDAAHV